MSARPQQTGRAAQVRRVLSMFPQGATVAQIKTAGRINGTHQAIGYTLKGLARSGQAICHRSGVRGIWRLSNHTQHAIAPLRVAPARVQATELLGLVRNQADARDQPTESSPGPTLLTLEEPSKAHSEQS